MASPVSQASPAAGLPTRETLITDLAHANHAIERLTVDVNNHAQENARLRKALEKQIEADRAERAKYMSEISRLNTRCLKVATLSSELEKVRDDVVIYKARFDQSDHERATAEQNLAMSRDRYESELVSMRLKLSDQQWDATTKEKAHDAELKRLADEHADTLRHAKGQSDDLEVKLAQSQEKIATLRERLRQSKGSPVKAATPVAQQPISIPATPAVPLAAAAIPIVATAKPVEAAKLGVSAESPKLPAAQPSVTHGDGGVVTQGSAAVRVVQVCLYFYLYVMSC